MSVKNHCHPRFQSGLTLHLKISLAAVWGSDDTVRDDGPSIGTACGFDRLDEISIPAWANFRKPDLPRLTWAKSFLKIIRFKYPNILRCTKIHVDLSGIFSDLYSN